MSDADSHSASSAPHDDGPGTKAERPRIDTYHTRILSATALALVLLIGVLHLPLRPMPARVGWHMADGPVPNPISYRELMHSWIEASQAPSAEEDPAENREPAERPPDEERDRPPSPRETPALPSPTSLHSRPAVMNFSENMPSIEGGLGAYYIHITYPQAAIDAGIEGRLVLEFIVGIDGVPSGIEVIKPLHPLCDSAAVRALRKTRFVPGRHNDEAVAVRMRLPVLFELINRNQGAPGEKRRADSTLTASW